MARPSGADGPVGRSQSEDSGRCGMGELGSHRSAWTSDTGKLVAVPWRTGPCVEMVVCLAEKAATVPNHA